MAYQGYLKASLFLIVISATALNSAASSNTFRFNLFQHHGHSDGPTILIIGGIQGDEPGGFTAATLIAMNYQISKGNVWIVPNLNFKSILHSSRGIHGDMNRKFLNINPEDPDYEIVRQIKKLILHEDVDLILNLHDGSGFYSPKYIDSHRNPYRWGQSVIIDQETIASSEYANLKDISDRVARKVNQRLREQERYYVKNTRTPEGNKEMEKTLTYFAIKHGKAAFGIEASKSFLTHHRAFYHLCVIEAFMDEVGVEFQRDFGLNSHDIKQAMYKSVDISLYDDKFYLPGSDLKKNIYYVPMKRSGNIEYRSKNPLVAILSGRSFYKVKFGNRNISHLHPQYFEFDHSLDELDIIADGITKQVKIGDIIEIKNDFQVVDIPEYRVNVIGARIEGKESETGVNITRAMLPTRFSIDKSGKIFRVELYRGDKYSGMILVKFQ